MERMATSVAAFLGVLLLAATAEGQEPAARAAFPDATAADSGASADAPPTAAAMPPQPPRPDALPESVPAPAPPSLPPPTNPPVWTRPPEPAPDASVDRWEPPPKARVWYGGQTLLVDALSIGAVLLGATSDGGSLAAAGGLGYVFGGPIVHAAHGHVGKPFASFGMRVGLPIGGALLGCAAQGKQGGDFGCLGGAALGFLAGGIAAISLDAGVIAYDDAPEGDAPRAPIAGVTPSLVVARDRASLGLHGWF